MYFQYLDQRFDMKVRIMGACVFFFQTAFYMAIVTYSPALAIEAGKFCITTLHPHTPLHTPYTHPLSIRIGS